MKLEKILEQYGLNKKQAIVYLACLELGSSSVYKISKKCGLPRSSCYETIESLKKNNLISSFKRKNISIFTAENPKNLIEQTKKKIELLEESLPQFNALFGVSKNQSSVRYYQGIEGMKIILNEVLNEADELMSMSSADNLFANLGDYWPKFLEKRIKRKIPVRAIVSDSLLARERKKIGPQEIREVRLLATKYNVFGTIFTWKNKIAYFSYQEEMMALVIESKINALSQQAIFNALWDSLEK